MNTRDRSRNVIAIGACVCAAGYLLVGCVGDLVEIKPPSTDLAAALLDLGTAPSNDGGTSDDAGGSTVHFTPDIQTDLDSTMLHCSQSGCHGTITSMHLVAHPTAASDIAANYAAVMGELDTTTPSSSLLLQNALGMQGHNGGTLMHTTDAVYQRWLAWITAGAPK